MAVTVAEGKQQCQVSCTPHLTTQANATSSISAKDIHATFVIGGVVTIGTNITGYGLIVDTNIRVIVAVTF